MKRVFILTVFMSISIFLFAQKKSTDLKILNATESDFDICTAHRNLLVDNINWVTSGYFNIGRGNSKNAFTSKYVYTEYCTDVAVYIGGSKLYTYNSSNKTYSELPTVSLYRIKKLAFEIRNAEKLDNNFIIDDTEYENKHYLQWDKDKLQLYTYDDNINRVSLITSDYLEQVTFYKIRVKEIGSSNKIVISYSNGKYIVETF